MKITSQNTKIYTKEGKVMIIMDLKINNFFAFKNFHINMSYPKKIVDSYIEGEFLNGRENFRYKKVNILMGGNATGKTSIGLMLMVICNFIKKKESIKLVERIGDKEEEATITIDFVGNKYKMYRVDIRVLPVKEQSLKICCFISVNCGFDGSLSVPLKPHPMNALSSINVTLSGISKDPVSVFCPENALLPMVTSVCGNVSVHGSISVYMLPNA